MGVVCYKRLGDNVDSKWNAECFFVDSVTFSYVTLSVPVGLSKEFGLCDCKWALEKRRLPWMRDQAG